MIFQIQKWEENVSNYVFDVLLSQPIHINANRKLGRFLCNKNLLSSLHKMPDGRHACHELINAVTVFQLCRSKYCLLGCLISFPTNNARQIKKYRFPWPSSVRFSSFLGAIYISPVKPPGAAEPVRRQGVDGSLPAISRCFEGSPGLQWRVRRMELPVASWLDF